MKADVCPVCSSEEIGPVNATGLRRPEDGRYSGVEAMDTPDFSTPPFCRDENLCRSCNSRWTNVYILKAQEIHLVGTRKEKDR